MFKSVLAATAAIMTLSATATTAATLSYVGTNQSEVVSRNDLGLGLNGTTLDFITGDLQDNTNGLSVSGPARVTFTYLGFEAGNQNYSASMGNGLFEKNVSAIGDTVSCVQTAAGLIDFLFGTSSPMSA